MRREPQYDQDSVDIKSIKKSPLTLRLLAVLVLLAAVYGICICSINLEQPWVRKNTKLLELRGVNQSCHPSGVEEWEVPYLHYPQPKTYSREECACNPVRFFSILSMQRSGSGWFETLLNSHINVSSNGEIFSVAKRRENVSSILKTMDEVFNLDWFSSASKNECSAAVGYKWMLNQAKVLAKYRPRINTTLLMPELKRTEETAAKAIEYFKNTRHIVLYYEDLVKNRTKLKDVQEFLRLPYRELHSRQVKIHTAPLEKQIENWDEVQEALKGTPYQSFLLSS
ncbi:P-loop containing nucleoside triphosphate hydrolase [Sesbania bispinosa]|nr:P-loop containing nucleoside triphosphate hydrolase [Sesbania bispinosa]